jgi:hypothetical protein
LANSKGSLDPEDLGSTPSYLDAENAYLAFDKHWEEEIKNTPPGKEPSLWGPILRTFGLGKLFLAGFCFFVGAILRYAPPQLARLLIQAIDGHVVLSVDQKNYAGCSNVCNSNTQ